MTIDEAIERELNIAHKGSKCWKHCSNTKKHCKDCMAEHEQIAEWLEELKRLRENANGYNKEDIEMNRKAMYNKAIYDVMKLLNVKNAKIQYSEQTDINAITIYNKDSRWISEQLKAGGWNEVEK